MYRELSKKGHNAEYRRRYHDLTGDTLPELPPLPPVPDFVTAERYDLDSLLERVERMIAARR